MKNPPPIPTRRAAPASPPRLPDADLMRTDFGRAIGMLGHVASAVRIAFARATGATIGSRVSVGASTQLALQGARARRGALRIGDGTDIASGVLLHPWGGSIDIGVDVHIGPQTVIYGHGGVEIGDHALISPRCCIVSSNHEVPEPGILICSRPDLLLPTRIGRDVWLGAGVTVLGGVSIGDGCVVGAGAVVTKDLPPNSIASGVPAEVKSMRGGVPPR